tara:strand:+ start:161 stop:382 length:222 start_codon:yes stop_codon:yes gene_type:complete
MRRIPKIMTARPQTTLKGFPKSIPLTTNHNSSDGTVFDLNVIQGYAQDSKAIIPLVEIKTSQVRDSQRSSISI